MIRRLLVYIGVGFVLIGGIAFWRFGTEQGTVFFQDPNPKKRPAGDEWWHKVPRPDHYTTAYRSPEHVLRKLDRDFAPLLQAAENEIKQDRDAFDHLAESERYKILAGPNAPLRRDANLRFRRYLERLVETYRSRTSDPPKIVSQGEKFLSQYLDSLADVGPVNEWNEITELGEATVAAGSTDPLIRMVVASMQGYLPDKRESSLLAVLDETAIEMEQADYPALPVMLARHYAWAHSATFEEPFPAREAREHRLSNALLDYLAEDANEPMSRFTWWLTDWTFDNLEVVGKHALVVGAVDRGDINKFVLHMMAGVVYRDVAWDARGEGLANTVSEEGWKRFHEMLPKAGQHFITAWAILPSAPEPPTWMIGIANAGGDDRWKPVDWFHVATRAQLDHRGAYYNLKWAFAPRWGGSHRQLLAFAHKCLDTGRWDTDVPSQSIAILGMIQEELSDEYPFGKLPGVLEVLDRFVDGLKRAKADGVESGSESLTNWAYAAAVYVQGERYADAHELFEAYGDGMVQNDFDWAREKLTNVRGLCAAMTGPAKDDVPALRKWVEEKLPKDITPEQLDAPLAELERLRTLDDRDVVKPYWDDVAAILNQLQTYHRGEWVELSFDETLSGLYLNADYQELEDGVLRFATGRNTGGGMLRAMAWFEPPLIVEGEVAAWEGHQVEGWLGVYNGSPKSAIYGQRDIRGVVLDTQRTHNFVYDEQRFEDFSNRRWTIRDERQFHHLRLKLWLDEVHHFFNFAQMEVDQNFEREPSGWVFFGGMRNERPNAGQLRNLRVRKLDFDPPPESPSIEVFAAYWRQMLEIDPNDAAAILNVGTALYHEEEYGQAEQMLRRAHELNPILIGIPLYLARVLAALGRYPEAIEWYERVDPNYYRQRVLTELSWIYAAAPDEAIRNPGLALAQAKQAQQMMENDQTHIPQTCRALAAAHARMGNYDEAAEWMRKMIDSLDDDIGDEVRTKYGDYLKSIESHQPIEIVLDD